MKIRKGDTIVIIKGKDKGKKAKVLRGFPLVSKILVEGVNIKKKHQRPKREGEKGQVVEVPSPIPVSNVKIVCSKCNKASRIGFKKLEKRKIRICKKCNEEI